MVLTLETVTCRMQPQDESLGVEMQDAICASREMARASVDFQLRVDPKPVRTHDVTADRGLFASCQHSSITEASIMYCHYLLLVQCQ